jgi:hypothetical protein
VICRTVLELLVAQSWSDCQPWSTASENCPDRPGPAPGPGRQCTSPYGPASVHRLKLVQAQSTCRQLAHRATSPCTDDHIAARHACRAYTYVDHWIHMSATWCCHTVHVDCQCVTTTRVSYSEPTVSMPVVLVCDSGNRAVVPCWAAARAGSGSGVYASPGSGTWCHVGRASTVGRAAARTL